MQIQEDDYLDQFTKQLLPITFLRRKAGLVLKKLENVGTLILTKDGKPVAKIIAIDKKPHDMTKQERLEAVKKAAGGFHLGQLTPRQIKKIIMKQYDRVLPG